MFLPPNSGEQLGVPRDAQADARARGGGPAERRAGSSSRSRRRARGCSPASRSRSRRADELRPALVHAVRRRTARRGVGRSPESPPPATLKLRLRLPRRRAPDAGARRRAGRTAASIRGRERSTSAGSQRQRLRRGALLTTSQPRPTARGTSGGGRPARRRPRERQARPSSHGSSSIRSLKNSHTARSDGEERQRDEDPRQPVDLAAGEQPEDHEQRVQPQRRAHHVRDDDVPLDLVDEQEEQRDPDRRHRVHRERVEERRQRAEPRPEVRDQLGDRDEEPEEQRVRVGAGDEPERCRAARARARRSCR